jgi:transcriptional regulator with XRE-family HTH domain
VPPRRAVTGRSQEPKKRLIEELVRLRADKGIALRPLGERLGWDHSTLGKLESGESLGSPEIVQALDAYYGTGAFLLTLWELAIKDPTQFKEQYRRYMLLEADAISLWQYSVNVFHGLLQTEDYARALLSAGGLEGDELTRQVNARMGRRELLTGDGPPTFRAILSEAVLRTPLSDAEQWRAQLAHLLEMEERRNITVHVLEQSVGLHALTNTDTMFLRTPDGRTVAWVETGYSGELIEETAAVERLMLRYDAVRDLALSPAASRKFIMRVLEEAECGPVST